MKIILATAFIFCTVSAANAVCAPEENLYFSCELRDRNTEVSVCFDDDTRCLSNKLSGVFMQRL